VVQCVAFSGLSVVVLRIISVLLKQV